MSMEGQQERAEAAVTAARAWQAIARKIATLAPKAMDDADGIETDMLKALDGQDRPSCTVSSSHCRDDRRIGALVAIRDAVSGAGAHVFRFDLRRDPEAVERLPASVSAPERLRVSGACQTNRLDGRRAARGGPTDARMPPNSASEG
jgi:hypothetical protein